MPALGIRLKLFLACLGLTGASVAATNALTRRYVGSRIVSRIREDLLVRLSLVERDASAAALPPDRMPAWDALADDLGARAHARVTLIRTDGQVLGDSEESPEELKQAENHATRPEVRAALSDGAGYSIRMSATRARRMMYVAAPMRRGEQVLGVARLAVPLTQVDDEVASVGRMVSLGSVMALAIGSALALVAAQGLSRRTRRLTEVARRIAGGELDLRADAGGGDELATVATSLNAIAIGHVHASARLREERELLERVLEAMREGVLVLDQRGRVALVNSALREMLLLGRDVVGKAPGDAVVNAELLQLLQRAAAGDVTGEIDIAGLKPRRVLVTAGPLPGTAGGLAALLVDVTEVRRLEGMRRDFVANVSHELRTPLASAVAAAETLNGGALSDPVAAREFLAIVTRNLERLRQLVEDVLDLSRIESQDFHLDLKPQRLDAVVRRVLALFEQPARRRRIRMMVDISPVLGDVVADSRALEQILSNLIDNALKYGGDGSEIVLRAVPDGGWVQVSVADTGPGIAPEHIPRLFERFYRVDPGRSRDVGGTGLGLSIVKHLVEAMKGRVSVESQVGKGTTFTVVLQRA